MQHSISRASLSATSFLLIATLGGCGHSTQANSTSVPADGGSTGSGGMGGGAGTGVTDPPPAPPTSGVPRPSGGTSPNLKVLPWAGFSAAMSYTFDDSQPSHLEHIDELLATGVPMTYFVNPSGSGQAGYDATWTKVAKAGSEIGNHTWSHCHADLTGCTPVGSQEEEIDNTNDYIMSHFGVDAVYSFASPFGDVGWNTYAESRFLLGRGVQGGMLPPSGASDWYNLPCVGITAGQTSAHFNASIENARAQGRWGIFLFHSILPTANNWYAGVEIADIVASVDHAKSLGDVWVDTMIAVGAYVRAAQMFAGLTPTNNTWSWTLPQHFPPGKVLRVTVDGGSLSQGGAPLSWDSHGYYEVALDAGTLSWSL